MGTFRDCLGRQTDEAVRLELTELLGYVLGDRGEGVGGRTLAVLNRRIFSAKDCAASFLSAMNIIPFFVSNRCVGTS